MCSFFICFIAGGITLFLKGTTYLKDKYKPKRFFYFVIKSLLKVVGFRFNYNPQLNIESKPTKWILKPGFHLNKDETRRVEVQEHQVEEETKLCEQESHLQEVWCFMTAAQPWRARIYTWNCDARVQGCSLIRRDG